MFIWAFFCSSFEVLGIIFEYTLFILKLSFTICRTLTYWNRRTFELLNRQSRDQFFDFFIVVVRFTRVWPANTQMIVCDFCSCLNILNHSSSYFPKLWYFFRISQGFSHEQLQLDLWTFFGQWVNAHSTSSKGYGPIIKAPALNIATWHWRAALNVGTIGI